MNRSYIKVKDTVFVRVVEAPGATGFWRELTQADVDNGLDSIDFFASNKQVSMEEFDNWNLWMLSVEDHRFKRIAAYLEGT